MRSPNPYTNTYIAIAFYLSCLDGIKACVESGKDLKALEKEISKKAGEEGFYLDTDRQYRTEEDVFEDFTAEERSKLFGEPLVLPFGKTSAPLKNIRKRLQFSPKAIS